MPFLQKYNESLEVLSIPQLHVVLGVVPVFTDEIERLVPAEATEWLRKCGVVKDPSKGHTGFVGPQACKHVLSVQWRLSVIQFVCTDVIVAFFVHCLYCQLYNVYYFTKQKNCCIRDCSSWNSSFVGVCFLLTVIVIASICIFSSFVISLETCETRQEYFRIWLAKYVFCL